MLAFFVAVARLPSLIKRVVKSYDNIYANSGQKFLSIKNNEKAFYEKLRQTNWLVLRLVLIADKLMRQIMGFN